MMPVSVGLLMPADTVSVLRSFPRVDANARFGGWNDWPDEPGPHSNCLPPQRTWQRPLPIAACMMGPVQRGSSRKMSVRVGRRWRLVSQDQRQVYTTAGNWCDDRAAYVYHTLAARNCVLIIEYGGTGPGCHPE